MSGCSRQPWEWDLELSPRLYKRMEDRSFNKLDVRAKLEAATD